VKYAIVEVFGHRRYAGAVSEVTLAGQPMLEVSVPGWREERTETRWAYEGGMDEEGHREAREVTIVHEPYVVLLGGQSLFSVSWCDEGQMRESLESAHLGPTTRTESPWRAYDPYDRPLLLEQPAVSPPSVPTAIPMADPEQHAPEQNAMQDPPWCKDPLCYRHVEVNGTYCARHADEDKRDDAVLDTILDVTATADLPPEPGDESSF